MKKEDLTKARIAVAVAAIYGLLSLTGCGGTKILKKPMQINLAKPLMTRSDDSLSLSLDWVIIRDGPGTWAKNADWDEYLISVVNDTDDNITIVDVVVVDSLGTELRTDSNRKQLVMASKKSVKRYRDGNLTVTAGWESAGFLPIGVGAGVVGPAHTTVCISGVAAGTGALLGVSAIAVDPVTAAMLAAPVSVVYGIVRARHNSRVAKEIEVRQTPLPHIVTPGGRSNMDLFFPLAPSPAQVRISYRQGGEKKTVNLETSELLAGLHIVQKESD